MSNSEIQAVIDELGLTVDAKFVPFSQSRNKGERERSLNWVVTVKRNGRDVLSTDYMAGSGHCPAYKHKNKYRMDVETAAEIKQQTETGFEFVRGGRKPILPDTINVLYSLVSDSSVIDSPSFEDWAGDFGYDVDSRKAEKIYRDCLATALKLRNAIGTEGFEQLQVAFQDY